jgi:hypothetical protein
MVRPGRAPLGGALLPAFQVGSAVVDDCTMAISLMAAVGSLVHVGTGLALVGFLLGGGAVLTTRARSADEFAPGMVRGQFLGYRALRVPLLLLGVVGLVLIVVGVAA